MNLNDGFILKINYKKNELQNNIKRDKFNYSYNRQKKINEKKYMICGGFYNKNGGSLIYKVNNIDEANEILNNTPLFKHNKCTYEIYT